MGVGRERREKLRKSLRVCAVKDHSVSYLIPSLSIRYLDFDNPLIKNYSFLLFALLAGQLVPIFFLPAYPTGKENDKSHFLAGLKKGNQEHSISPLCRPPSAGPSKSKRGKGPRWLLGSGVFIGWITPRQAIAGG